MCGIAGFVSGNILPKAEVAPLLERMSKAIIHRGPDGYGTFHEGPVHLAHRRLSIIDLSETGSQPMHSHDGNRVITYNGEVYNYLELREKLDPATVLRGSSDTEVILELMSRRGCETQEAYPLFNGMFAFALFDRKAQKLHLVRDRFGIKPLYYYVHPEGRHKGLYFASEIKSLLCLPFLNREVNREMLSVFLAWGLTDHTAETFHQCIHQIPPGSQLVWDIRTGEYGIQHYYRLEEAIQPLRLQSDGEYVEQFRELLLDSIRFRLRSDVPVGSCLSGGLDSSAVVGTALQLWPENNSIPFNTFTSRMQDHRLDEWEYASLFGTSPKVRLNQVFPDSDEFRQEFDHLIHIQDGPFRTASIFAQWNVMRKAKEEGIKVLLDGQGGDELMCGYRKFYVSYLRDLLRKSRFSTFMQEMFFLVITRNRLLFKPGKFWRYLPEVVTPKSRRSLDWLLPDVRPRKPQFGLAANVADRQLLDINHFSLPNLLHNEDRNSMAFSIEARVPFLDYRLVEFLLSVPPEVKMKNGVTKRVMRSAIQDWVPEKILKRRSKLSFDVPEQQWYKEGLKTLFNRDSSPKANLVELGLISADRWRAMQETAATGSGGYAILELFRFMCAERWLQIIQKQ